MYFSVEKEGNYDKTGIKQLLLAKERNCKTRKTQEEAAVKADP